MLTLYPDIRPYATHRLAVDPPHELYVEECGNPDGIPVLFVHGGPGSGCSPKNRCYFDPERYRIILFDQRGAGRSTPHALLEGNTTQALVDDIERIRDHLGVNRWVLFGGSWGSALSLVYAQTHTEHVLALVLRGIFLSRKQDTDWFYQCGASRLFPDYWQDYLAPIPAEERRDMVGAYYRVLTGDNEIARMAAAKAWSVWEARCSTLHGNQGLIEQFADPHYALAMARIEAHYCINDSFLAPDQILNDCQNLKGIRTIIVHGRYDVVCPIDSAFSLAAALPGAELQIIRDAGHSASEPGITDALVRTTQNLAKEFG